MQSLENIAKELNRVLNFAGHVCEVKIISNKIRIKYFDIETLKYEKRLLTFQEAGNIINTIYQLYGLDRKRNR